MEKHNLNKDNLDNGSDTFQMSRGSRNTNVIAGMEKSDHWDNQDTVAHLDESCAIVKRQAEKVREYALPSREFRCIH